jgi:hypothetical protein
MVVVVLIRVEDSGFVITGCSEERPLFHAYVADYSQALQLCKSLGAKAEVGYVSWGDPRANKLAEEANTK